MLVSLNGEIINENDAKINISLPAFRYGQGLFTTTRIVESYPIYIEEHLKRLKTSMEFFNFKPLNIDKITAQIKHYINAVKITHGYLRILVWRNNNSNDICIMAGQIEELKTPVKLTISTYKQLSSDPFIKHKTFNYWKNELIYNEARASGYYDAIILNEKNMICETSRCNIFWKKDGKIFTPDISCGILPGIEREKVIENAFNQGIIVETVQAYINELYSADEIFLTNSVRGIIRVCHLQT